MGGGAGNRPTPRLHTLRVVPPPPLKGHLQWPGGPRPRRLLAWPAPRPSGGASSCLAACIRAGAERSDGPCSPIPSGRAETRRAWGGRGHRRMAALRALTRCGCPSGALQARSKFRSAAPGPSIAGCPQRSEGTRQVGSPFLCLLSFGDSKESRCAAGRTSRPTAPPETLRFQ